MTSGPHLSVPASASDVQVTRHFSPIERKITPISRFLKSTESTPSGGNFGPDFAPKAAVGVLSGARFEQAVSFCDWVSIYQTHQSGELTLVNDGCFVRYDAEGAHESTTLKKLKIDGSHETGIFLRCDGSTVWFEGNVSKFARQDNVFGFSLLQCIERINAILATVGLPPFTCGMPYRSQVSDKLQYTGARITRLDLTNNFASGSSENSYAFMRHLSMQQASRLKTGVYGKGETVDFGRGSRRVYSKAYLKAPELLRHMKKQLKGQETNYSRSFDPYINSLAEWCDQIGLVRFETTYKSTFLIDNHHQFLGGLDMRHLEADFVVRQDVFTRANCEADELASLDKNTLSCYRMWQAGDDITSKYKKSQFYKLRSALLPHGVDIAVKSNVLNFQPRVRVIKLSPCVVPDFYQLSAPNVFNLRLAA
jgi:Phage replication protein CRI/Phage X family